MNAKERNRAEFPSLAAMIDQVREFHPNARLVAGIENGREVGKVDDEMRQEFAQFQAPQVETEAERLKRQYDADRIRYQVRRVA